MATGAGQEKGMRKRGRWVRGKRKKREEKKRKKMEVTNGAKELSERAVGGRAS